MSGIFKIILAMITWGSLGVFVKNINIESFEIAFLRALIASFLLGVILVFKSRKENKEIHTLFNNDSNDKRGIYILIVSGVLIGFNWVLLFASYSYTTISNSTLSYYFAPVIVIFLSPIFLKEKFTLKRVISVVIAMSGLFLIVKNQVDISFGAYNHTKGIILALGAAFLYASVIMLNKYTKGFGDYERTFIQLFAGAIVLLPFIIARGELTISDMKSFVNIIILGVVHTTIAYCLYFSAIQDLRAQSAAILSYIDPVSAILFSVIFLGEPLSIWQIVGGSVILVSAFVAEMPVKTDVKINIEEVK